jgi:hypothetical protein
VLFAFIARAAVAVGYMPTRDAAGHATVKICPHHGVMLVEPDEGSTPAQGEADQKGCPYALSQTATALPELGGLLAPHDWPPPLAENLTDVSARGPPSWSPHAPPTGPPSAI